MAVFHFKHVEVVLNEAVVGVAHCPLPTVTRLVEVLLVALHLHHFALSLKLGQLLRSEGYLLVVLILTHAGRGIDCAAVVLLIYLVRQVLTVVFSLLLEAPLLLLEQNFPSHLFFLYSLLDQLIFFVQLLLEGTDVVARNRGLVAEQHLVILSYCQATFL